VSIQTEVTTYRFTLPSADPEAFSSGSYAGHHVPVECEVHVLNNGDVTIAVGSQLSPMNRPVLLSLKQFNQLRAKVFEVTGKVV
jgi:hypothetical protein